MAGVGVSERQLTVTATSFDGLHGLCQMWIEGSGGDINFALKAGAGLGNPDLVLNVTVGDRKVTEIIDVRAMVQAWVDAVVHDMNTDAEASSEDTP